MSDPLIVPPGAGKSAAQRYLPRVLLAISMAGEAYYPENHFAEASKMVLASRRRDHIRRIRVFGSGGNG